MKHVFALLIFCNLSVHSFSQSIPKDSVKVNDTYTKQFLALKNKVQFDITYYLDGGDIRANDLQKIQDSIKAHCQVFISIRLIIET